MADKSLMEILAAACLLVAFVAGGAGFLNVQKYGLAQCLCLLAAQLDAAGRGWHYYQQERNAQRDRVLAEVGPPQAAETESVLEPE